jgi:deoxycytidine triphosphate deaminase
MDEVHEWKYIDPKRKDSSRKGMLLSNEIEMFRQKNLLIADEFIEKNLRPAAYTLRIGTKFIDSKGKPGKLDDNNSSFVMEPNSIVYVSTYEQLNLPYYIAARFNLRVKWVYKGILLGTGPQVEPGYRGYLSCPLYNLTNSPFRITFREDFATIDFERTTDLWGNASLDEIKESIECGDEFDKVKWGEETYLLFKQKEYPPLKLLPGYDILSSLSEMEQEVRTWRHIGIAFAVSFFALTLTLLSFGSNVFRQTSDLTSETKIIRSSLQSSETAAKQAQHELDLLKEKVAAMEKITQAKQTEPVGHKSK